MRRACRGARNHAGVALAAALFLLLLMSMAAIAGVRMSLLELRLAANDEVHAAALQGAQSLLDAVLANPANTEVPPFGALRCLESPAAGFPGVECRGVPLALPGGNRYPWVAAKFGVTLARLPPAAAPPPIGSGYGANRFQAARLSLTGVLDRSADGMGRARVQEGLSILARRQPHAVHAARFEPSCTPGAPGRGTVLRWNGAPAVTGPATLLESALRYSQPVTLEYGTGAGTTTVIAFGASDGFLRLARSTAGGADVAWAFRPAEAEARLPRMADGLEPPDALLASPAVLVQDTDGNGRIDAGSADRAYLYAGLRRAGSAYYAFDITDPDAPRLLWKAGAAGRATGPSEAPVDADHYAELGLAFPRPRAGWIAPDRAALFIGGGYDGGPAWASGTQLRRTGKDDRGNVSDSEKGNALFVLDALTGELIWKAVRGTSTGPAADPRVFRHAGLRDAIAAEVALLDADADGIHDRILAADTGGNVWRADLGPDPSRWKLVRLGCLGRHGGPDCEPVADRRADRRFFHAPEIVQHHQDGRRYDVVLAGSGDPENLHDLAADTDDEDLVEEPATDIPHNRLFAIFDPNTAPGTGQELDLDPSRLDDLGGCSGSCGNATHGWYVDLAASGEKVLSAAASAAGTVQFTSYVPPATDGGCASGNGRLYAVALADGSPVGDSRHRPLIARGVAGEPIFLGRTGGAAPCSLTFAVAGETLEVPGCTRFRTAWHRPG